MPQRTTSLFLQILRSAQVKRLSKWVLLTCCAIYGVHLAILIYQTDEKEPAPAVEAQPVKDLAEANWDLNSGSWWAPTGNTAQPEMTLTQAPAPLDPLPLPLSPTPLNPPAYMPSNNEAVAPIAVVPEPTTGGLMACGILGLALRRRR